MRRRTPLRTWSWRLAVGCGLLASAALWAVAPERDAAAAPAPDCRVRTASPAHEARVRRALAAGRDVWGDALRAAPAGPTLAGARRYLSPLLLARGPKQKPLTDSGVYYVPFAQPDGPQGAGTVALHVADGSQIVAQRVGGRALTVGVGIGGRERYGSCLTRLTPSRLADGWLPILQTAYVDGAGARYRQESFAARPGSRGLVSFVSLEVDARRATRAVTVRFAPRATYRIPRGTQRTVYATWPGFPVDEEAYVAARASVERYWKGRLATPTQISVPEPAVANALRALLVQSLVLTWRYSIGNPYEQFSFPESPDVARVLAAYGLTPVARSILRTSLTRDEDRYRTWKRGSRLVALAAYYRLSGDAATVRQTLPLARRWVADAGRQLAASDRGLLPRERYSSDIPDQVYGLHAQAVMWEGLRSMSPVWRQTGDAALAARARSLAERLGVGLRRAVAASQRRLPDGSLFVPVRLLDRETPYDLVVQERLGSYWNLVMPYALASGLFPPGGPQARGVLRYQELHGSRLLGLVRAGAYALYGRDAYPASGTNHVYDLNVARFLAENDQADELVLKLYGSLAAALTPDTFVSGEAASVAPLPGTAERAMYLPPNGASGAAFLETVRLLLVQETRDRAGAPHGLRLAYATPRGWLRPGGRIAVTDAPTSFGSVSYEIVRRGNTVAVTLAVPARRPATLGLRLRLPAGLRLGAVEVGGAPHGRVDRTTGTIDLTGRTGEITVQARLVGSR